MGKTTLIAWLLLAAARSAGAQSADSLQAHAAALTARGQEDSALMVYRTLISRDSGNLVALTQASMLAGRQGERRQSKEEKAALYAEALSYARSALGQNTDDLQANIAMALALDRSAQLAGAKEKMAFLRDMRTYTDRALKIDSTSAGAWYLSGLWHAQISQLNFAEKAAAKLLFGGLPPATLEQAIADFSHSLRLDPAAIRSYYALAKAYHAHGEDLKAIEVLRQALRRRPIMQDDPALQARCREMIQSLQ